MTQSGEYSEFVQNVLKGQNYGRQGDNLKYKNNGGKEEFKINISDGLENNLKDLAVLLEKKDTILQDYTLILEPNYSGWRKGKSQSDFLSEIFVNRIFTEFIKRTKVHTLVMTQWVFPKAFFQSMLNYDIIEFKFTRGKVEDYQYFMTLLHKFGQLQKVTIGWFTITNEVQRRKPVTVSADKEKNELDLMTWFGYDNVENIPHSLETIEFEYIEAIDNDRETFLKGIDALKFNSVYRNKSLVVYLKV